jgi:hypothetical protein
MASEKVPNVGGELIQFKIVEKAYEVKVPTFVEVRVEVPKYEEVLYEKPVIKEVEYEKPVVKIKDLTKDMQEVIRFEIQRAVAEVIASLKVSLEIPLTRILQVRQGSRIAEDVTK